MMILSVSMTHLSPLVNSLDGSFSLRIFPLLILSLMQAGINKISQHSRAIILIL